MEAIPVGSVPTGIGEPRKDPPPGLNAETESEAWLVTKARPPRGPTVIRDGPSESSIVSTTSAVLALITAMPPPRWATKTVPPSGVIATPSGSSPTAIGSPTVA